VLGLAVCFHLGLQLYSIIRMLRTGYWYGPDKVPAQNGDKFQSIFSDNLQPIATRGKKARGMLLVDKHCGNSCSIKCAPLSVSYYNAYWAGRCSDEVFCRPSTAAVIGFSKKKTNMINGDSDDIQK